MFLLGSLIGKRVVDLLVLIELFAVSGLRRYQRISIENRRFFRTGSFWPKISGTDGRPTPTLLCMIRKLVFILS